MYRRLAHYKALAQALPSIVAGRTAGPLVQPRLRFVYDQIGPAARYRVDHQIEQAQIAGVSAQNAPLHGPANPYDLSACDLLYLYRLPLAPRTAPLLIAARRMRIPIIFDTDDLVWDLADRWYSYLDQYFTRLKVARILFYIYRTRLMMRYADALVVSTPYLARLASQTFAQPVFVNPNSISRSMMAAADRAHAARLSSPDEQAVVIGYFSGTPHVHEADLASIGPALCAVLGAQQHVRLRIYGGVQLNGPLADPRFAARIEHCPLVPWADLLAHVAQADIAIAPLVDNPQRRSKSAVKFMEAALVGVPIVAVRLEPYQDEIAHGHNGLLASTSEEWVGDLTQLIESAELRRRLGEAARHDVLARHTTTQRAANFASIIAEAAL